MRLTSSLSVWLTASESMLKLRARIRLETRLRTPGLLRTTATRTCRRVSPPPGSARDGGALWAGAVDAPPVAGDAPEAGGDPAAPAGIRPLDDDPSVIRRPRPTSRSGRIGPCRR